MRSNTLVLTLALAAATLVVACGSGSTTPAADLPGVDTSADAAPDGTVDDVGADTDATTCTNACPEEGDTDCAQGGVRTCADIDDDGCLEWSTPVACPGGKTCQAGVCSVTCADAECSVIGAHQCGTDNQILECGDYDADGCLQWGNPIPCTEGLVCSQGFCATSCSNACTTIGARKCDLNTVVVCGDYNTDGCLEWGDPQDCGSQTCANGFCKTECSNECTEVDARKCDGDGYKVCGAYDGDPCLEYGTVINCGATQSCSNGYCTDTCANECTATNARKCDEAGAVVACGNWDDDPCLEWGSPSPCEEGLVCAGGFCESQCQDECTVAKAKKCDEAGKVVQCDEYDGDGCLEWGSATPCSDPLVCDQGNCKLACTDECSVKFSKRCSPGSTNEFQACDEYDGDGCLEWGTAQACTGTLVCSGQGECTVSCSSDCAAVDLLKCDGEAVRRCDDYNGDSCLEWGTPAPCALWQSCSNGVCSQKDPPAKVVISEILFDTTSYPDTDAFVELAGPAGTDLTGWTLVGVNGSDGTDYQAIDLAGTIGSDGFFVVAHPQSAAAIHDTGDQFDGKVDYQNGPDSVHLRYGTKRVDAIGYGTFKDTDTFAGEGIPAAKPVENHSLSRNAANEDTDINQADFVDRPTPTPGASNVAVNEKPVASLSCPGSVLVGQQVTADGSASNDSDGSIASFAFDFGDGSAVVTGAASSAQHTYATTGTKTITLTVTDNGGSTDSTTCQVAVGDDKVPTVVVIKPADNTQVTQGSQINMLVDATPAAGRSIASLQLLVDGVATGDPDPTAPYEFTYVIPMAQPKDSTVVLQAKALDNAGSVGISDGVHLLVRNDPPVASFTAVVSGALEVTVDASASTDTETASADLQVRWDFDNDGTWDTTFSTTQVATYVFESEGEKTIRMEVKDGIGQTTVGSRTITLSSMQVVSGTVTTTTWTGTIVVTGDVVVPAGNTLTIAEGTSVLFTFIDQNADGTGDYDLVVNGTLKVNGTAAKPVLFTVYGSDHKQTKSWNRITLNGTGSTVDWAIVEYADIGLEVKDDATVRDTTVRLCTTGLWQQNSGKTATLTRVISTRNTGDGMTSRGGTQNATSCTLSDNGGRGAFVQGGTLNLSASTVSGSGKAGLEWQGAGSGEVTENLVTGSALEGIRITTSGGSDPNPVINYNNVYGNAIQKARVVAMPALSATTDGAFQGTRNSGTWSTPGGETIQWIHASYSEYDYDYYNYENGNVRKDNAGGTQIWSASTSTTNWTDISASGATTLLAQVTDSNNSSYYGSTTVDRAAFDQAGATREMSVITTSGTVDLKHNYWGTFPKVLDVLSIGTPNAANIEGFVGVPFDATWTKGPYVGGETLSSAVSWAGDIFVTGNLTISGTTLTVAAGTKVQFAPIDQNLDGAGDYTLTVANSTFTVNGTEVSPVLFTTAGAPAAKSYQEVKVHGTGTATIAFATFERALNGLHLETGSHTLTDVTVQDSTNQGLWLKSNTGTNQVTLTRVTARRNTRGIRVESVRNLAADRLTVQQNTGDGIFVTQSGTELTLSNSTISNNGGSGLSLSQANVEVDHCNIQYNQVGVRYDGTSAGSLSTSAVKYNDREGVLLWSTAAGNPNPVINNNNVFGNAVKLAGTAANPGLAATTDASYQGTKTSSAWSTPAGETILAMKVAYSEYDYDYHNYENGNVRKDSAGGTQVWSASTSTGAAFVDVQSHALTTLVAQVTDSNNSSYYGSTTVDVAYYYASNEPTVVKPTELSAITNGGKVVCRNNYWGAFPDPTPRFALGRTDAIDYEGFQINAFSDVGPQ